MMTTGTFGCYGKLPCAGDFIRRGLSHEFVRSWDEWLQSLLLAGRAELGDRWQECYLGAPIWRFAASPGQCGPNGAAGVLMPSVDRVGRQFPICLAAEIKTSAWSAFRAAEPLFAMLEETALTMLDDSATIEELEASLARLSVLEIDAMPEMRTVGGAISFFSERTVPDIVATRGSSDMASIWVAVINADNRVMLSKGMPNGQAEAAAIFDLDAHIWSDCGKSAEDISR